MTIDELVIEEVSAELEMQDGKLTVRNLIGQLPSVPTNPGPRGAITINGEVDAKKPYSFRATAKVDHVALENFERLKNVLPSTMALEGEASAQAELRGTFSPFTLRTNGCDGRPIGRRARSRPDPSFRE
jgi:hypothetical protein